MLRIILPVLTLLLLFPVTGITHGQLDINELEERFTNTTQLCRNEKDKTTCTTYFSEDGVIKRRMHADNKKREGTWEVDLETDNLCITWKGKTKRLCFIVYRNMNGILDMYKGGRHISTVLTFNPGNTEGL